MMKFHFLKKLIDILRLRLDSGRPADGNAAILD